MPAAPPTVIGTTQMKIRKAVGTGEPDALENSVSKILLDMETSNSNDLARDLRSLHFTKAREVELGSGRRAVVIYVPVPQLRSYQRVHQRLVREMEKKFADKHVVIVADRRIISKTERITQKRPISRTLKAVHEALMTEMVYPTEVIGKRTRISVDGARTIRVMLDQKDQSTMEHKLDTFGSVYRKLTGKNAIFQFSEKIEA